MSFVNLDVQQNLVDLLNQIISNIADIQVSIAKIQDDYSSILIQQLSLLKTFASAAEVFTTYHDALLSLQDFTDCDNLDAYTGNVIKTILTQK